MGRQRYHDGRKGGGYRERWSRGVCSPSVICPALNPLCIPSTPQAPAPLPLHSLGSPTETPPPSTPFRHDRPKYMNPLAHAFPPPMAAAFHADSMPIIPLPPLPPPPPPLLFTMPTHRDALFPPPPPRQLRVTRALKPLDLAKSVKLRRLRKLGGPEARPARPPHTRTCARAQRAHHAEARNEEEHVRGT